MNPGSKQWHEAVTAALGGRDALIAALTRGGVTNPFRQSFSFPAEYDIPGSAINVMVAMPAALCTVEAFRFLFVAIHGEMYTPEDDTNPSTPLATSVGLALSADSAPPAPEASGTSISGPDNLGYYALSPLPNLNSQGGGPVTINAWNPLYGATLNVGVSPVSGRLVLETDSFKSTQAAGSGAKVRNLVIDVVQL